MSYSPRGFKELDMTERLKARVRWRPHALTRVHTHTHTHTHTHGS